MIATPETLMSSPAPDVCHQVLDALLLQWPEEPGDVLSPALLDHLCQCRGCLRKWIALEAAADLASQSIIPCDDASADVDYSHLP